MSHQPSSSESAWPHRTDPADAVDRILDAAGHTFVRVGVAAAKMTDIADAAGCSRATLYRYFPDRDALDLAFVHRSTLRAARRLAAARANGGSELLADRLIAGLESVRSDPAFAMWFEPENLAVPVKVSQNSELLLEMSAGIIDAMGAEPLPRSELQARGAWLLRSIISLLAMPVGDPIIERSMIETMLVPVLLGSTPDSALDEPPHY